MNVYIGRSLNEFLEEEGILADCELAATERILIMELYEGK